jgi:Zn2+/Cd2+-exporting ATPase
MANNNKHSVQSGHDGHAGHEHEHDHKHEHGESCAAPVIPPLLRAPEELAAAKKTAQGMQTPIRIMQMDCPTEEGLLRSKLTGMPGVTGMEFNLMKRVLTVTHEPTAIDAILAAIRSLDYTPEVAKSDEPLEDHAPEPDKPWWPLALAGLAAIGSEAAHWASLPTWLRCC